MILLDKSTHSVVPSYTTYVLFRTFKAAQVLGKREIFKDFTEMVDKFNEFISSNMYDLLDGSVDYTGCYVGNSDDVCYVGEILAHKDDKEKLAVLVGTNIANSVLFLYSFDDGFIMTDNEYHGEWVEHDGDGVLDIREVKERAGPEYSITVEDLQRYVFALTGEILPDFSQKIIDNFLNRIHADKRPAYAPGAFVIDENNDLLLMLGKLDGLYFLYDFETQQFHQTATIGGIYALDQITEYCAKRARVVNKQIELLSEVIETSTNVEKSTNVELQETPDKELIRNLVQLSEQVTPEVFVKVFRTIFN